MNIESILAVTDFSTAGEHALERAASIAARHQAKRLIHGVRSDILVFPHDYQAPSNAVAKERIQTLLRGVRTT